MNSIRQTAIVLGSVLFLQMLPGSWEEVFFLVAGFLAASLTGVIATTLALAGVSFWGLLPMGFFHFVFFVATPEHLRAILAWYSCFGVLIGSLGLFMAMFLSTQDEDFED